MKKQKSVIVKLMFITLFLPVSFLVCAIVINYQREKCYQKLLVIEDVYDYDLKDYHSETEIFKFNEIEQNLYYRIRNLYLSVGKGESDCMVVRYDLPNPIAVESLENSLDLKKILDVVQIYYGEYNYFCEQALSLSWVEHHGQAEILFIKVKATPEFKDFEFDNSIEIWDEKINTAKTKSAYMQITKKTNEIIEEAKALDDYNKIKHYIMAITAATDYDDTHSMNDISISPHTILSVFDERKETLSVCDGYARAFQYLCDNTYFESDIDVYTVVSDTHCWNVVKMEDGLTYNVDVSFIDAWNTFDKSLLCGLSKDEEKSKTIEYHHFGTIEEELTDISYNTIKNLTFANKPYETKKLIGYKPGQVEMD